MGFPGLCEIKPFPDFSFVRWNRDTGCRVSQTQVEWAWIIHFTTMTLPVGISGVPLIKRFLSFLFLWTIHHFFLRVSKKHPWRFKCFNTSSRYLANCAKTRNDMKTLEVLTFFPSFKSVRRSTALCHSCAFPKALITASAPENCKGEKSTRNWWRGVTDGRPISILRYTVFVVNMKNSKSY